MLALAHRDYLVVHDVAVRQLEPPHLRRGWRRRRTADPAARIGWALMGSTTAVGVRLSVQVGARAGSDPTNPG